MLYKVPQSDASSTEERNKEDVSFCLQLFNTVLHAGVDENDLINVFRLGRLAENEGPRPLMVQFAGYSIKNLVMESLYKLKHAEQKFIRK